MSKKENGSITIFLSFIILIILAVITTVLEAARIQAAFSIGDYVAESAGNSLLTEYYKPLYDNYHLFFLNMNNKEGQTAINCAAQSITDYIKYSLLQDKEKGMKDDLVYNTLDLFHFKVNQVVPTHVIYATDYHSDVFQSEAVEYMKYKVPEQIISQTKNWNKTIKQVTTASELITEKIDTEEKVGELDRDILDIMEQIDGIDFNRSGIRYTKTGKIKVKSQYLKKFCTVEKNAMNLGINNSLIWDSLKDQYFEPLIYLNIAEENLHNIESLQNQIEEYYKQLNHTPSKKKGDKDRKKIEKKIEKLNKEINKSLKSVRKNLHKIFVSADNMVLVIDKIFDLISPLSFKQEKAEEKLKLYEQNLKSKKYNLESSIYEAFEQDLIKMQNQISQDKNTLSLVSKIKGLQPLLEENKDILHDIILYETPLKKTNNINILLSYVNLIKEKLKMYHITEFSFDYSNIKPRSNIINPIETLSKYNKEGILSLIVEEPEKLSSKSLLDADKFYKQYSTNKKDDSTDGEDLLTNFTNADKTKNNLSLGKSFQIKDVNDNSNDFTNLINSILMGEYGIQHFNNFRENYNNNPFVNYEIEYLIAGKKSDKENIKSICNKITLFRTILNYLSLISDKEKSAQAYGTAAALVGFTGLEPLISITKNIILLVWGYEESLVDMACLLAGKSVPIWKNSSQISMKITDLILLSRELIQEKVKHIENSGVSSILDLKYIDYIRYLLLLTQKEKKNYRMMDLIEQNMKQNYNKDFNFSQCIFSLGIRTEIVIPVMFLSLPFANNIEKNEVKGWSHRTSIEFSY